MNLTISISIYASTRWFRYILQFPTRFPNLQWTSQSVFPYLLSPGDSDTCRYIGQLPTRFPHQNTVYLAASKELRDLYVRTCTRWFKYINVYKAVPNKISKPSMNSRSSRSLFPYLIPPCNWAVFDKISKLSASVSVSLGEHPSLHRAYRHILHGVLHDVMRGDVIGANEDVFQVVFDVPIRVANRSGTTRQVHVDFDFVSTNVNLLNWLPFVTTAALETVS